MSNTISIYVFPTAGDVAELVACCDDRYAVMCVHHDFKPTNTSKLAGKEQAIYPRQGIAGCELSVPS